MVVLKIFVVVIISSTFTSGRCDIEVSETVANHRDYVIDELPNPFQSGTNSEYNILPEEFDSTQDVGTSLRLCCPVEEAREGGSCVADNVTAKFPSRIEARIYDEKSREVSWENFNFVIEDPCDFDWMVPSVWENFFVLENGTISDADFDGGSTHDLDYYCLFRKPGSVNYSARVCRTFVEKSRCTTFSAIVIIIIMLAIFIVYTVIPEQKNLHGMIFRSYVATYIANAISIMTIEFTTESRIDAYLYSISDTSVRYFAISCVFWLNAMGFNMWRSFRGLNPVDSIVREREKQKYIGYAIYAWGGPAVYTTAVLFPIYYLPHLSNEIPGYTLRLWACVGIFGTLYICNAFLFASTALAIGQHRKDTADLVNSVNKHHENDIQWFNLHLKLFVLMGSHIAVWGVFLLWPSLMMIYVLATVEVTQALLMFVFFVCKKSVGRSFCKQIGKIVRVRLGQIPESSGSQSQIL